ncbi:hypothetical protein VIGAN_08049900, partial [Vigna angularis var. angularis]
MAQFCSSSLLLCSDQSPCCCVVCIANSVLILHPFIFIITRLFFLSGQLALPTLIFTFCLKKYHYNFHFFFSSL